MSSITFLYFAFGDNLNNYVMNNFSMLTIKKLTPSDSRFVIYTDKPEYYKCCPFVEIRLLDPEKIKEWKGKHNFVWRVKIMSMLDAALKDEGHLVYLDSDTIAFQNLSPIIKDLDAGYSFMHVKESLLSEDKAAHKSLMWEQTQNKTYGGMLVHQDSAMWNAGFIALSASNKIELLKKALASNDEMLDANVTQWLIEQFSLSQALASTNKLKPADKFIAHYWGNKEEWIQNINNFFAKMYLHQADVEESMNAIDIEEWKKIPIVRYKKSMGRKLQKLSNRFFKDSIVLATTDL